MVRPCQRRICYERGAHRAEAFDQKQNAPELNRGHTFASRNRWVFDCHSSQRLLASVTYQRRYDAVA